MSDQHRHGGDLHDKSDSLFSTGQSTLKQSRLDNFIRLLSHAAPPSTAFSTANRVRAGAPATQLASLARSWREEAARRALQGRLKARRASARPSRPLPWGSMELEQPLLALADTAASRTSAMFLCGSGRADGVSRGTAAGIWHARPQQRIIHCWARRIFMDFR